MDKSNDEILRGYRQIERNYARYVKSVARVGRPSWRERWRAWRERRRDARACRRGEHDRVLVIDRLNMERPTYFLRGEAVGQAVIAMETYAIGFRAWRAHYRCRRCGWTEPA